MSSVPAVVSTHAWKKPKRPPLSLLRMIWKRRYLLLAVWATLSIGSSIVILKLPAIYRADAVILVESQRIPERFVAPTVSNELKDRLATLGQQILSYNRLLAIVEKFDLYKEERQKMTQEEVIELMKSDVSIQLEESWAGRNRNDARPSAFRIAYQGRNPEIVALVANQLGNLFIDENLRAREVQAVGTSEFLNAQVSEAKKRLEEQEAKLSEFKLKHNGELPEQENALIATVGQAQIHLQGANDAVSRAEQTKASLEAALTSARQSQEAFDSLIEKAASPADSSEAPGNPAAPADTAAAVQRRLEQARTVWGENHPEVRTMRELLAKLREQEEVAASMPKSNAGADTPAANRRTTPAMDFQFGQMRIHEQERISGLMAQLDAAQKQLEAAVLERDSVMKDFASLQARIGRLPIREQELAVIRRDYEMSRANYQSLLDKGLSADMAAEMERRQKAERFTMIDSARVPAKPVKPDRPLLCAIAALLSLIVGLGAGLVRESHHDCVLGEWELPKGAVVLGRVPFVVPFTAYSEPPAPRQHRKLRLVWAGLALVVVVGAAGTAAVYFGWIQIPGVNLTHG